MTSVEIQLLMLGALMVVTSGWAWSRTKSAWAVGAVVALYVAAAYYAGLIA